MNSLQNVFSIEHLQISVVPAPTNQALELERRVLDVGVDLGNSSLFSLVVQCSVV
jgi:hypothetical protein